MITSNKLLGFVERMDGDKRPITADIFITDYCNNRCNYCNYAHETGKFMSAELFTEVVDRLRELGVRGVILTGGGEPTVNPDFDKIVAYLEAERIPYGMNTNFNIRKDFNPVWVKVSVDAGTREEYKRIRGVDKFDEVAENVRYFLSRRKESRIGLQCVSYDLEQVKSFYDYWKDFDVDYFQFRPIEGLDVVRDYGEVLAFLDEASEVDGRIYKSYKYGLVDWLPKTCLGNWSTICVRWDANVPYCCAKPNNIVGSVFELGILEKKRFFQNDMRTCEKPCRLTGVNNFLENYTPTKENYFL